MRYFSEDIHLTDELDFSVEQKAAGDGLLRDRAFSARRHGSHQRWANWRAMSNVLLAISLLCLVPGCTETKRDNSPMVRYSEFPPPAGLPTPQVQPVPRGEPPPFIFVGGEFKNPGRYAWTNGMTLKDGIEAAGGFAVFAPRKLSLQHWDDSVEHFRLGPGRALTNNPLLRAGDSVRSPRRVL